jgi:hypothetical protein
MNSATKNLIINGSLTNNGYLIQSVNFTNNGTYTDNSGTVEIRQNGTISGNDISFYNLEVKGGSLTNTSYIKNVIRIPNGIFNVSSGTLILQSDGTYDGRVGTSTGGITGNFIWQKYLDRTCLGWSMYSYPSDNPTLSDIDLFYTFSWWRNTYWYDETVLGIYDYGWVGYTNSSQTVPRGLGIMQYNNPFTKTLQLTTTLPNTFTYTLDYTFDIDEFNTGWNIIGNPYPGTIDWDNGNWTKTGISNAIYTWIGCNQDYGSYVDGIGTGGMDGLIPSGESFWVQVIDPTYSLVTPKSTIVDDSNPMMKTSNNTNMLRITLMGDDIVIRVKKGTDYFDPEYDAYKMGVGYIKTMDDEGTEYSINTLPNKQQTVPLWTRGNGTMFFEKSYFQNSWKVYIEDLYTNNITLLDTEYEITGNSDSYEHRYNIIFTKKPLVVDDVVYKIRYESDKVIITSDKIIDVKVYDMMGRQLQENHSSSVVIPRKFIKFVYINGRVEKIF